MDKLTTATGKAFDCDYFNPSLATGQTNLRVLNTTVSNVAVIFSNPNETVQLRSGEMYAAEYTRLIAIVPEGDAIRVVLGKE